MLVFTLSALAASLLSFKQQEGARHGYSVVPIPSFRPDPNNPVFLVPGSEAFGGLEETAREAQIAAASGSGAVAWMKANELSQDFFAARAAGKDIPERAWAVARAAYQRRPIPTEGWVAPWAGEGRREVPEVSEEDVMEGAMADLGHLLS